MKASHGRDAGRTRTGADGEFVAETEHGRARRSARAGAAPTTDVAIPCIRCVRRARSEAPYLPDPICLLVLLFLLAELNCPAADVLRTPVNGLIRDAATRQPIAARLYVRGTNGTFHFAESAASNGLAARYDTQSYFNKHAIERHTALSAHPFRVLLPPGRYTFTVERGKEFHTLERTVDVGDLAVSLRLDLSRFANMAARGWFSGDTHVHRDPAELPAPALADDVNVVLPMTDWTIESDVPPVRSSRNIKGDFAASPIDIDATHVIYPRNTEYEIFSTAGKRHTLGAFLAINHRERLDIPALPWRRVAERVRAEGGLIDFEKHNWEWSAALAPVVKPDLFELANNHFWRTEFGVTNWAEPAPAWMGVGTGGTRERDWAVYGWRAWYAFLNCGFNPRPTAGTAHGVHPVPLGYGRVYVHLDRAFSYNEWIRGLNAGRSFVTTGPLLLAEAGGKPPGHRFSGEPSKPHTVAVKGTVHASRASGTTLEILFNGEVVHQQRLWPGLLLGSRTEKSFSERIVVRESGWLAVRCWREDSNGRFTFAHTAPWWFDLGGPTTRTRHVEAQWLAQRVRDEIERNRAVLTPEQLREYEEALAFYQRLLPGAQ